MLMRTTNAVKKTNLLKIVTTLSLLLLSFSAFAESRITEEDGVRFYNCGPYGIELQPGDDEFLPTNLGEWLCGQIELLSEDFVTCAGNRRTLNKELIAAKREVRKIRAKLKNKKGKK